MNSPSATEPAAGTTLVTWAACLVALGISAGSVYLSVEMELKACPLCFYQRTFAFAALGVLLVGLLVGGTRRGLLSLLALPLAIGGLGVAGFHDYLELTRTLECPLGVGGVGTAPQQSLAALVLLTALLAIDVVGGVRGQALGGGALMAAVLMGGIFSAASVVSSPPLPKPPPTAYATPLDKDGCRPPFKASKQ